MVMKWLSRRASHYDESAYRHDERERMFEQRCLRALLVITPLFDYDERHCRYVIDGVMALDGHCCLFERCCLLLLLLRRDTVTITQFTRDTWPIIYDVYWFTLIVIELGYYVGYVIYDESAR